MTMTPDDCEALIRDAPALRNAAPVVRARTQVIYGNRNWVPSSMFGTTTAFLEIRDWALAEGEPFTERDILNANTRLPPGADPRARALPGRVARRQGGARQERVVPGRGGARSPRAPT